MIEIFKTNVTEQHQAELLIRQLQQTFADCEVTFDLEDCDKILRVMTPAPIDFRELINLLERSGFHAEILPDVILEESHLLQMR